MIAVTVATGMGLVASAGRFAAYSEHLKRLAGGLMIVAGVDSSIWHSLSISSNSSTISSFRITRAIHGQYRSSRYWIDD